MECSKVAVTNQLPLRHTPQLLGINHKCS